MGVFDRDRELSQWDEEIAEMEREFLNSGEQGEGSPDGPSKEHEVLTDANVEEEIVREDPPRESQDDVVAKLRKELADEKHRFGRYKGSTDKTIFNLRQEVKHLTGRTEALMNELRDARTKLANLDDPIESIFNQEVVDVLGEEAVDAIKKSVRMANQKAAGIEQRLETEEANRRRARLQKLEEDSIREFFEGLEGEVPDWKIMDRDPGFNEWLRKPDASGVLRHDELLRHQQVKDYMAVAEFFKEYKEITASKESEGDSVSAYAGPTGSQRNSSSESAKKPVKPGSILQSEINQYYRDMAAGKYKYKIAEAEKIETRIFNAEVAGLVIPDVEPN